MGVLLQNDHPVGGISADVIEDINFDLTTNAKNLPGAINELNGKSSTTVSVTQAEYDALPSSKLTDDIAYYIKDGVPDVDNALWNKVGTATLETTSKDCSGAINELNSSLEIIGLSSTDIFTPASGVTMSARPCYKRGKEIFFTAVFSMSNPVSTSNTLGTFKNGYIPNTQYYSIGMSYSSGADAGSASLVNAGNIGLTAEHTSAKPYLVVAAKYITN